MKKNLPKTMAIILLTVIALLIVYISTGGLLPLLNGDKNGAIADADKVAPPAVTPPAGDGGSPGNKPDDTVSIATKLPKKAVKSELYEYEQTIVGSASITLNATYMTSEGIYIVVSASSKSGDIVNNNQGINIFRMDLDGTLTTRLVLECSTPSYYIASALTSDGIAIITNEYNGDKLASKTNFYIVSYDLKDKENIPMAPIRNAKFFVQESGCILFVERTDSAIYYIKDKAIISSTAVQSGTVLMVLEFNDYFNIIINGVDCYSVITLNDKLVTCQSKVVTSSVCLQLIPIVKNGVLFYLAVEKTGSEIYLKEYNSTFSNEKKLAIGSADTQKVAFNGSSVFILLTTNNINNLYIYDTNMVYLYHEFDSLKTMRNLFGCMSYAGGYVLLYTQKEGTLSLIDIRNNGSSALNNLDYSADTAQMLRTVTNKIIVFSEVQNGIRITAIAL